MGLNALKLRFLDEIWKIHPFLPWSTSTSSKHAACQGKEIFIKVSIWFPSKLCGFPNLLYIKLTLIQVWVIRILSCHCQHQK